MAFLVSHQKTNKPPFLFILKQENGIKESIKSFKVTLCMIISQLAASIRSLVFCTPQVAGSVPRRGTVKHSGY